jgi:hypothetical protein
MPKKVKMNLFRHSKYNTQKLHNFTNLNATTKLIFYGQTPLQFSNILYREENADLRR